MDRSLRRLGESLADDERRKRLLGRLGRWARRGLLLLTLGYGGGLLLLVLLLRAAGENNMTLAFVLYWPRQVFLLPLPFLLLLTLPFSRWQALVQALCGAAFLKLGLGLALNPAPEPLASPPVPGESLVILSYNRGQHMGQSLRPFKAATEPDIIAFQEAGGRAARFAAAEGYEDLPHGADLGEFTVVSRFPILSVEPVEMILEGQPPVTPAARFEIDWAGERVALYNVHFRSPRDTLNYYRRGAFLWGVLGLPGTPWNEKRLVNQRFWDHRIDQARELARRLEDDPLPVLVAGDFNAPAGGYIHGLFRAALTDAHEAGGRGFGFTFPGTTRNPLSRGGPWMRIDYLFARKADWTVDWCVTEPDRPSQHRALAAKFSRRADQAKMPRATSP